MFDQSTVASVNAPTYANGQVFVSWNPTTAGLLWQVYINSSLSYEGHKTGVWLSVPSGGVARCDIGSILDSEAGTDFSSSLPSAPARRVKLSFNAGTELGADLDHFVIYGESTPGGGIDYSAPLATLSAFAGGDPVVDGQYSWVSGPLYSGTWNFAVVPVDVAGNKGTLQATSATVAVPPGEPGLFSDGSRLKYQFHANSLTPTVTLSWNAAEHP